MAPTTRVNENPEPFQEGLQDFIYPLNITKNKRHSDSSSAPRPLARIRLPLLNLLSPETDTLIYVYANSQSPPLRCSSQKLLATGSPVFERLLGPTYQFRILRRKNLLRLGLPIGIKFVVDLSPPTEGEEAVDAVECLWCPDEILGWHSNLDGNYIEEDQYPPHSPRFDLKRSGLLNSLPLCITDKMESDLEAFHEDFLKKTGGKKTRHEEKPVTEEIKEKRPAYSPIRHTGAIERMLHIIHGLDPQISTTPMWYTVHKVALQMECTAAVQDHLLSWLYQNQAFIERYPGFVLRTAAEMKNPGLYRDAFAILVGKQLVGGNMKRAGVFNIDESIPPEAEPWGENIVAAKRSLQGRLERLYNYIDSTAWLDNAKVIPEYKKIAIHLNGKNSKLRRATSKLDAAIRAEVKAQLADLFAFSEDPGDPNWMNPWEKAMFDMMPGRKQIFCRMYWKQLLNFSSDEVDEIISPEVVAALREWCVALQAGEEEGVEEGVEEDMLISEEPQETNSGATNSEVETAICLLSLGRGTEELVETDHERAETRLMSSVPKHRYPMRTRRQSFGKRSTQNTMWSSSSRPLVSGPTKDNGASTEPPYSSAMNSVLLGHKYEHELSAIKPLDDPPPYELHVPDMEKVGEKRKMRVSDSDGTYTDMREVESHRKETEFIDTSTTFHGIGSGRIEIENPMRKRRCSIERDSGGEDEDENITEASFFRQGDTEAGEPEMFNLSGVYPDPRLLSSPSSTPLGKGKEKAIEDEPKNTTSEEYDMGDFHDTLKAIGNEYQLYVDPIDPPFDESITLDPTSCSNYYPSAPVEISYWPFSQNQTLPPDRLTTAWDDPPPWDDPKTGLTIARHINNQTIPVSSHTTHTVDAAETSAEGQTSTDARNTDFFLSPRPWAPTVRDTALGLWLNWNVPTLAINLEQLKKEIKAYLNKVGSTQLKVPISFEPFWAGDGQLIVSLREEEWDFCPAWAGGLDTSGIAATVDNSTRIEGRMVELEIRGGLSSGLPKGEERGGDETEEEYDDCATETASIGSFSTSGFSSFGVISEFDGESDNGTVASDDVQFEVETESLLGSDAEAGDQSATEAGDSSDSDDGFEELAWEEEF